MKKIIAGLALVAVSSASFATEQAITATDTGATATVTGGSGGTCPFISQSATIKLSKGVAGAYDCSSTAAGVATYHSQGKGKVYSGNSGGGAISEATGTAATGAATTALNAAGGTS